MSVYLVVASTLHHGLVGDEARIWERNSETALSDSEIAWQPMP